MTKTLYAVYNKTLNKFKARNGQNPHWTEYPTQLYDTKSRAEAVLKVVQNHGAKQIFRPVHDIVVVEVTTTWVI